MAAIRRARALLAVAAACALLAAQAAAARPWRRAPARPVQPGGSAAVPAPVRDPQPAAPPPSAASPVPGQPAPGAAPSLAAAYAGAIPSTWAAARAAIGAAAPQERETLALAWVRRLQAQGTPLLEGGQGHFFYYGPARSVAVASDLTRWQPVPLARVAGSDLWAASLPLPADAVVGYRLLVDGKPRTDPLNPRTSRALDTHWSVYVGPQAPGEDPPAAPAPGRTVAWTLYSRALGRTVPVRVHIPPGCTAAAPCAALYVADGPFYLGEGRLTQAVAALHTAGRAPAQVVVAVAPPPNPILRTLELLPGLRPGGWHAFLAGELLPAVEDRFPVARSRERRAVLGMSAGAAAMLDALLRHPDRFSRGIIQSPAEFLPVLEAQAAAHRGPPLQVWLTWGRYERNVFGLDLAQDAARIYSALERAGVQVGGGEQPAGHTMGFWRRDLMRALTWVWR